MDLISLITSIFLLLLTHLPNNLANVNCPISRCGGESGHPDIRFPFRLKNSEHPTICGSPGFDVSCDPTSNRTFIELQGLGNMFINNIDYGAQEIWVNDPNNCLPQKLLSLNLSNSPFSGIYLQDFGFFNCSTTINTSSNSNSNSNNSNNDDNKSRNMIGPIKCLSSTNYFVYATPSNGTVLTPPTCNLTSLPKIIKLPVQWPPWLHNTTFSDQSELNEDLRLTWFMPECQPCELNGQMCGLETNSNGSLITVCSNIPISNGTKTEKLPKTTVIAIILVICSPSIICIIASIWIWIRACIERRSTSTLQQNRSILTQRPNGPSHLVELGGLEEFNIEFARQMVLLGLRAEADPDFQPNIVFSEIEEEGLGATREGDDDNNTCAICMGEYEVKDKIGSLPTCGHYFHAYCINTWLIKSPRIIGKTCPICRARVGD